MSKLLTADKYPVPNEDAKRLRFARNMSWTAGAFTIIGILCTIWAALDFNDPGLVWSTAGVTVVGAGIFVRAITWYYQRAKFEYSVSGVKFSFHGDDYYVPPYLMRKLVNAVIQTWQDHLDVPAFGVYEGITVSVFKNRPIDPLGRTDKVVGLTYHSRRYSEVWGPYILDPGGAGYELLLHGAEYKWPNSDEGEKIANMKELGIFKQLVEEYDRQFEGVEDYL
jgi:hypothetical protein